MLSHPTRRFAPRPCTAPPVGRHFRYVPARIAPPRRPDGTRGENPYGHE